MRRRRKAGMDQKAVVEKAAEVKDTAKELAGAGGEAMREFLATTGQAAKEFASQTASAARELLDITERASERLQAKAQPRRRGRKVVKTGLMVGAGAAVLGNQKVRALLGKLRGRSGQSEAPWERPMASGNGEIQQADMPATTTP